MHTPDQLARISEDVVVSLETSNLGLGCRLATPFVQDSKEKAPVYTCCDLDGAPPSLTPHFSAPLQNEGVRLFSTNDPPEVACDIMLLSKAPPTREAYLLDNGEVALLTWAFSSEQGLLKVHCQAMVEQRSPDQHNFGLYHMAALSAVPGLILQGMAACETTAEFLRTDSRALPLLVAATKSGVQLSLAADFLLHHAGVDDDLDIVRALCFLTPQVLTELLPRIESAGLREDVEDTLLSQLGQPRSWLEPLLVERIAVFNRPSTDDRILGILRRQGSPWIAWWLMAQAMEAVGNRTTAGRLGCGALEKLPTSMKTIELLERCGGEEAIAAIVSAVAWMRLQQWHMRGAAEAALVRLCPLEEAESRIQEAIEQLQSGTQSSSRVQTRR